MKLLLVLLALASSLGYYLILALCPAWLAGHVAGLPAAIVLALAAMLALCLIATFYGRGTQE
ncbi:hypothetical protein [Chromobacterium sp. IIBBL 290-4]|uniref:hypothetical protein n=1 Tax=Chromobacterium sp. IIBBL 290-4 TaxID=2953890 RepID=UPI0020B8B167|nr:hypothetical protein [Chromobacterium sp. IIBBL 290-4]UTH75210.1 hypothetical protein NKT35_03675 [Chromobacterium sp. IIBBL 290-4]